MKLPEGVTKGDVVYLLIALLLMLSPAIRLALFGSYL
jgi:hypothetical protein